MHKRLLQVNIGNLGRSLVLYIKWFVWRLLKIGPSFGCFRVLKGQNRLFGDTDEDLHRLICYLASGLCAWFHWSVKMLLLSICRKLWFISPVSFHLWSANDFFLSSICLDNAPFSIYSVIITGFGSPSKSLGLNPINLEFDWQFIREFIFTSWTVLIICDCSRWRTNVWIFSIHPIFFTCSVIIRFFLFYLKS